jgi:glycosyltransferase involved in cell wall biosynthesis
MDLVGGPLARLHGVPWILSERSSAVAYPGHPILRARRLLGRLADAVLANSEAGVAYWSAGPSRHRLRRAIGNAIDLPAIRGTPPDDSRPWRSDVPTVLFVGRLVLEKDLPTLARAFARLRASCPAQLVVVGDGPLRGAFETELTDAGVQDAVTFLGVRGDVWALMKRADVLVLGSTVEGHPNVVIEAMACGLPLVVSRIPAHTGFLSEREALFHPPSDSDALAAVLAHALTDRSAATTRAAAAERLVTQYAITRITDQHEQFYRELLGMTTPQARATAEGRA